jgi:myo-inositol-1(or 4)-monophosphatase
LRGRVAIRRRVVADIQPTVIPDQASERVTDWLATCRLCVADISEVLRTLPTRVEREPVLRRGQGGDDTTAIDQGAEDAVVERLAALGEDFVLVSEELGERTFGAGGARRVVVDPIDGSVNAKRGIPFFSFSLAVAEGETMGDVVFGYVYDFGTGEEWTAERGRGAFLDGTPLGATMPKEQIEILSFEGTTTAAIAETAPRVLGIAERVRVMGSLALSLCHLADGRVDAACCLKAVRSVDIAAAQLLLAERGIAVELFDDPPLAAAPLDLGTRSRLAAARTPELVLALADALR